MAVQLKLTELDETNIINDADYIDVSIDNGDTTYTSKKVSFNNVKSSILNNVIVVTSNYVITSNNDIVICNNASGMAITLPIAAASNRDYEIINGE